jgi:predicted nucleic acid-binding protein
LAVIVADTDVLIDALRGHEPMAARVAGGLRAGTLGTTVVTLFELMGAARDDRRRARVVRLLRPLPVLGLDRPASEQAAEIRRELESAGASIGMADCLIAGICLVTGASLLTRNRKHFARVRGLSIVDSGSVGE